LTDKPADRRAAERAYRAAIESKWITDYCREEAMYHLAVLMLGRRSASSRRAGARLLRVASADGDYPCRPETLAYDPDRIGQFLDGISQLPVPLAADALVISDNGDIYGTIKDMDARMAELIQQAGPGPGAASNAGGSAGCAPDPVR